MEPFDYEEPTLGEVDTCDGPDPEFGMNTGSPGVNVSSWDRKGVVSAKTGRKRYDEEEG